MRAGLRLPDETKAVLVAKVEPGSPARLANIQPFELITALDGEAVASADEFGRRIAKAVKAGKRTVRVTIELLGKTRLADLDIQQAGEVEKD